MYDFECGIGRPDDNYRVQQGGDSGGFFKLGNNFGTAADRSGNRVLGPNLLSGAWTHENMNDDGAWESTDASGFTAKNTSLATRGKVVSPEFTAEEGCMYEAEWDVNIRDINDHIRIAMTSGPTSTARDSVEKHLTQAGYLGIHHCRAWFVWNDSGTDTSAHLVFYEPSVGDQTIDFTVSNFTFKKWTAGIYGHGEIIDASSAVLFPSTNGNDGVYNTDGTNEYLWNGWSTTLSEFTTLNKGGIIVKFHSSGAATEHFMGLGEVGTDNNYINFKMLANADFVIEKVVAGVDKTTTFSNSTEGGTGFRTLIMFTDGAGVERCILDGVEKTRSGTEYGLFNLISGSADQLRFIGRDPNLTGAYSDIQIKRLMGINDALTTRQIEYVTNNF
jgi:hypothetical protein